METAMNYLPLLQRLQICQLLQVIGAWSLYIFAFRLHHKTSKGCYVYLSTDRPSVIDRFPRKRLFSDTAEQNVKQKPRDGQE